MSKYQLDASKEQFELIIKALDFYSRVQMGQVSELTNPYYLPLPDADYSDVEKKVLDLKKSMFPDLDDKSYYSIKSKKLPDSIRQSVDLMDIIRYRLYLDSTSEDKLENIQYQKPYHWSNEVDLAKIKKVDTNDT